MVQKQVSNTLFLGNGFSRSLFPSMPSWENLLGSGSDLAYKSLNNTLLYETSLLKERKAGRSEEKYKAALIEGIIKTEDSFFFSGSNSGLDVFGDYLLQHHVEDIITTNYDAGIEHILQGRCGYIQQDNGAKAERIYSIRTHKLFTNKDTGHRVRLWKIHGDFDRIKSVTLGFDQYCGSLAKLTEYIKGTYSSARSKGRVSCTTPIEEKCRAGSFDHLSWAELFFYTDVYIVGFGMSFAEIDIWWLLNKRARLMLDTPEITNSVTYLYDPRYDTSPDAQAIRAALEAFNVACASLDLSSSRSNICPADYLKSIFESLGCSSPQLSAAGI